jgi:geranylgeranyl diphosphate synthase type II
MIHTYSLIHDDLPAMDDDDLRRGRPTCHRAFGEALAILAGDALMTHAFLVLAQTAEIGEPVQRVSIIEEVARAAGSVSGMVGGQVVDIQSSAGGLDASALDRLHAAKTGALLTASVVTGGIAGGASADELATLRRFGASIGLAFQIADDILDVTSTAEELGKTPGKDAKGDKLTYPALFGIDESRRRAAALVDEAIRELANLDRPVERLVELARYVVARRR